MMEIIVLIDEKERPELPLSISEDIVWGIHL